MWLKDYTTRTGAIYADYWTCDGVHPNAAGYAVMAPVAEAAIRAALAAPAGGKRR